MSGRGDNNKRGSAGSGAGNQSKDSVTESSIEQNKVRDADAHRDAGNASADPDL